MNKRQAKKIYKKIHGHNPPKGKIPAVLLRNSNKTKKRNENNMTNEYEMIRTWRKNIRQKGDPVLITTRRLSENRKKNKGTAWRKTRRYR